MKKKRSGRPSLVHVKCQTAMEESRTGQGGGQMFAAGIRPCRCCAFVRASPGVNKAATSGFYASSPSPERVRSL